MKVDSVTTGELRRFGVVAGIALTAGGMLLWHRTEAISFTSLSALGLVFFFTALCCPGALKTIYGPFQKLIDGTTLVVTQILLFLSFYFIMTPLALAVRVMKRDPLRLTFDREAPSYWEKRTRERPPEPSDYERQY
jgi:hypothetical protein